ncbi:MAG: metallophosphoesterase family protein [Lachnospiraceae bacterium]
MKILVVSDTHKSHRNLEKVIEKTENIDMLIHLGDVEGGEDYIEALVDCPVHIVSGNNDFFSDLPREEEFDILGKHIFITHGHYYYVSMNEERLKEEAKNRGASIVMYGHTHRPSCVREEGLLILNPGSIAYPRQIGRKPTYIIVQIEQNSEPKVELMYI